MDAPVLADQQELTYTRSVRTQDVVWKTCQELWMIGTNGVCVCVRERERERERESRKYVLASRLDDDDDEVFQ